jgi:hypothetical protein
MNKLIKSLLLVIFIIFGLYIITLPNIFRPFSKWSAYDEGYKRATGHYPDNCSSICCKAHGKGFWKEFILK